MGDWCVFPKFFVLMDMNVFVFVFPFQVSIVSIHMYNQGDLKRKALICAKPLARFHVLNSSLLFGAHLFYPDV